MIVVAAGMIQEIRLHLTKGGDQMAFIKIADFDGSMEAVVFPKNYAEHRNILKTENCIALKGKLTSRNGELSMVAEALRALVVALYFITCYCFWWTFNEILCGKNARHEGNSKPKQTESHASTQRRLSSATVIPQKLWPLIEAEDSTRSASGEY